MQIKLFNLKKVKILLKSYKMKLSHIYHLYQRAGFGISYEKAKSLEKLSRDEVVNELFESSEEVDFLDFDLEEFKNEIKGILDRDIERKEKRKQIATVLKKERKSLKKLNIAWIDKMQTTKAVLRERMTLFWANHFVCHDKNILYALQYHNRLRECALGNFEDFILKISKEPSMQKYLNIKQNKKKEPNENFARELMELFTLGRDQLYTENDIKEAARAFTGWNHNIWGDFTIKKKQHDDEKKEFLGEQGNFDGNDIIKIITQKEECAQFICTKLYTYFVSDIINHEHISNMVKVFYPSYNISTVLHYMFVSNWFYEKTVVGTKIKSPIDIIIGINRTVPVVYNKPKEVLYLQKLLGQVLLYPPNVAGWKGGKHWINVNTLMLRMKLPSLLLNKGVIALEEKKEFEESFEQFNKQKNYKRKLHLTVDWDTFLEEHKNLTRKEIQELLLPLKLSEKTKEYVAKLPPQDLKNYCIQLMSLPEYQLC